VERRDLLRTLGVAAAFTLVPRSAQAAWARVGATPTASFAALTPEQVAQIDAIADTIFPRTDTPSATDVNVSAWIDIIVAEYYSDDERKQFVDGLAALDAIAKGGQVPSPAYAPESNAKLIELVEKMDRRSTEGRAYWRLKGLIVHGYFTSERVQKEVLKVEVMPGRFVGDAPHVVRTGS